MAKVVIFGGAGRVGQPLAAEITRCGLDVALADLIPEKRLGQIAARILTDTRLAEPGCRARLSHHGDIDVLDQRQVEAVLARERPALVSTMITCHKCHQTKCPLHLEGGGTRLAGSRRTPSPSPDGAPAADSGRGADLRAPRSGAGP